MALKTELITGFFKKAISFFRREEPQLAATAAKIDSSATLPLLKIASHDDGLKAARTVKELTASPNAPINQIQQQALSVFQAPDNIKTNLSASVTTNLHAARQQAKDPEAAKKLDALIGVGQLDIKKNIIARSQGTVPHDMVQANATNNLRDAEALLRTGAPANMRGFAIDTMAHNLEELNRVNPSMAHQRLSDLAKLPEFNDIKKAMGNDSALLNEPATARFQPTPLPELSRPQTAFPSVAQAIPGFDEAYAASNKVRSLLSKDAPSADVAPIALKVLNSPQKGNFAAQITRDLHVAAQHAADPAEAKKLGTLVQSGQLRLKQNIAERSATVVPHDMVEATATNNLRDAKALLQTGAKGDMRDFANQAIARNLAELPLDKAQQQLAQAVENPAHLKEILAKMPKDSALAKSLDTPAEQIGWLSQNMDQLPTAQAKDTWARHALQQLDNVGSHTVPVHGNVLPHTAVAQIVAKGNVSPEVEKSAAKTWQHINEDLRKTRHDLAHTAAEQTAASAPRGSDLSRYAHTELVETNKIPHAPIPQQAAAPKPAPAAPVITPEEMVAVPPVDIRAPAIAQSILKMPAVERDAFLAAHGQTPTSSFADLAGSGLPVIDASNLRTGTSFDIWGAVPSPEAQQIHMAPEVFDSMFGQVADNTAKAVKPSAAATPRIR